MGNIGDSISATIPAVGSAGPTYATNINLFLTEVKNRLETLIPRASLAAGDFDLDGDSLQNADYVGLAEAGATPTTPVGSIQRFDNDLYWINDGGAVQLTSGTTLNTSLMGGLTGDYGGANPAQLRFVDADQEFYAYDDFAAGAWARIWARNFDIAAGATGSERLRLAFGGGASYTATFPAAVPSETSVLSMDTSGNISNARRTRTKVIPVGSYQSVGSDGKRGNHQLVSSSALAADGTVGGALYWLLDNAFANDLEALHIPVQVDEGETITGAVVRINKGSDATNTVNAHLIKCVQATGVVSVVSTQGNSGAATGGQALTFSGLTETVASGVSYEIVIKCTDNTMNADDRVYGTTVTYTTAN